MTIITQDGRILNYQFIREIALYDAQDEDGSYVCLISAKNDKGEDINLAGYATSDEGETTYQLLQNAFLAERAVFSFADNSSVIVKEHDEKKDKNEPEKPSYKNRFIDKDR
jgi:hypothetical protein